MAVFHLRAQSAEARLAATSADKSTALAAADELKKREDRCLAEVEAANLLLPADAAARQYNSKKAKLSKSGVQSQRLYRMNQLVAKMSARDSAVTAPTGEVDALGITQEHNFPASHHYSGPHDAAGKVPRIGMRRDEAFERNRIYDYHKCFGWCVANMPVPKRLTDGKGTFGCTGEHKWRCYSNAADLYKDQHPHIPQKSIVKHSGVKGSNETYAFRGLESQSTAQLPVSLESKFMQCYCMFCRNGATARCPSKDEFGEWQVNVIKATNVRAPTQPGGSDSSSNNSRGRGGSV